jgi:DNA-binding NtrC family response regulator
MATPRNPQELANAIETLIASYLDEAHRAARDAIEASLSGRRSSRGAGAKPERTAPPASGCKRRTAAELAEVSERLHALVRARPGEAMAVFADEMGVAAHTLHRPMAKLKAEGRVRTLGQRHLTRYYPAVERASARAS